MSNIEVRDPVWQAILTDERLARARKQLSFHELRLIISHVRSEIDEQLRVAGFIRTSQGIGRAVDSTDEWRSEARSKAFAALAKIGGAA